MCVFCVSFFFAFNVRIWIYDNIIRSIFYSFLCARVLTLAGAESAPAKRYVVLLSRCEHNNVPTFCVQSVQFCCVRTVFVVHMKCYPLSTNKNLFQHVFSIFISWANWLCATVDRTNICLPFKRKRARARNIEIKRVYLCTSLHIRQLHLEKIEAPTFGIVFLSFSLLIRFYWRTGSDTHAQCAL